MATNNAVNNGLAGATGTGSFVGSTSPILITPILGAATATSITFSPTTNGLIGTTTNNNATSGIVGEFVSNSRLFASALSLTTGVIVDITSISLTAGDWDVYGNVGTNHTGSTPVTYFCWINTTSATQPNTALINGANPGVSTNNASFRLNTPYFRASLSATTTVFLSTLVTFSSGSMVGYGAIYAKRAR